MQEKKVLKNKSHIKLKGKLLGFFFPYETRQIGIFCIQHGPQLVLFKFPLIFSIFEQL